MNYFTKEELSCSCCQDYQFSECTLERLNKLREAVSHPIIINSGYRCKAYNKLKGYTQTHATGQAVDIAIHGTKAYVLLYEAIDQGFTGIGIKQKGSNRFIHLDDLDQDVGRPRPWIWSY